MTPGALVVYLADPTLYSVMEILHIDRDGRLHCQSFDDGAVWVFDAHEVDLAPDSALFWEAA